MVEQDSNGEHHPTVPEPLAKMHVFVVTVENSKTGEIERLEGFAREADALAYAESFHQHWITTRMHLVQVKC